MQDVGVEQQRSRTTPSSTGFKNPPICPASSIGYVNFPTHLPDTLHPEYIAHGVRFSMAAAAGRVTPQDYSVIY